VTFQYYVNEILCPHLYVFCITYLNDVLNYNEILENHICHICQVLGLFQKAGLQVKLQKYDFYKITTEYLEILIIPECLQMDSKKVSAVEQWPIPQQLHDIYIFIGIQQLLLKVFRIIFSDLTPLDISHEERHPIPIVLLLPKFLWITQKVFYFGPSTLSLWFREKSCSPNRCLQSGCCKHTITV
jgi:hypothetical protein